MAQAPTAHAPRETRTLQVARFVVKHRRPIGILLILQTLFFFYPILNAMLTSLGHPLPGPAVRVDTSARAQWPEHPFIHAQDKFAKKFGTSSLVAVGIAVKDGNIFTPDTLKKIHEITRRLDGVGYDSHNEEREKMRDELAAKGHKLDVRNSRGVGSVKGILIDPRTGVLHGGVSPTGDSYVMAW